MSSRIEHYLPDVESATVWRFHTEGGQVRTTPLVLSWEPNLSPMSDPYHPSAEGAAAMLDFWADRVRRHYPNGLVPIHWSVEGDGIMERAPFQHVHHEYDFELEDFLDFFSWPENAETGEGLNWRELPVEEKAWTEEKPSKGGFLQEATGWKPSAYQPYVYLPALLATARVKRGNTALPWARHIAVEGDPGRVSSGVE